MKIYENMKNKIQVVEQIREGLRTALPKCQLPTILDY